MAMAMKNRLAVGRKIAMAIAIRKLSAAVVYYSIIAIANCHYVFHESSVSSLDLKSYA
jgi:hypothetical protein